MAPLRKCWKDPPTTANHADRGCFQLLPVTGVVRPVCTSSHLFSFFFPEGRKPCGRSFTKPLPRGDEPLLFAFFKSEHMCAEEQSGSCRSGSAGYQTPRRAQPAATGADPLASQVFKSNSWLQVSQWWILGKGWVRMTRADGKYIDTHTHTHISYRLLWVVFYCFGNSSDSRANDGCLREREQQSFYTYEDLH